MSNKRKQYAQQPAITNPYMVLSDGSVVDVAASQDGLSTAYNKARGRLVRMVQSVGGKLITLKEKRQ